jgi:hypothetical protein
MGVVVGKNKWLHECLSTEQFLLMHEDSYFAAERMSLKSQRG